MAFIHSFQQVCLSLQQLSSVSSSSATLRLLPHFIASHSELLTRCAAARIRSPSYSWLTAVGETASDLLVWPTCECVVCTSAGSVHWVEIGRTTIHKGKTAPDNDALIC